MYSSPPTSEVPGWVGTDHQAALVAGDGLADIDTGDDVEREGADFDRHRAVANVADRRGRMHRTECSF